MTCTTTETQSCPAHRLAFAHTWTRRSNWRSSWETPLSDKELALINAYWRAANYLSVGQIYLYDNPLLKKPLTKEHVKPRLLGHWGTTPGLNFIYVHLNRVIKKIRPEHALHRRARARRPGLVANAYLEGTYSEVYPNISRTRRA
jgi:xylulose-5-phosphate/fructose-6-phosphate phosphoketolase